MSAWVSAAPAIGTGSIEGFAAAALMSVVCAMATTAPRRARRPSAARGGAHPAVQSAFPDRTLPRIGFSDGRPWRDARSGIVFPDVELAPALMASPRRPKARRLPRHAAPSVGLGSRITGLASRMTGLFATRALASGARG